MLAKTLVVCLITCGYLFAAGCGDKTTGSSEDATPGEDGSGPQCGNGTVEGLEE